MKKTFGKEKIKFLNTKNNYKEYVSIYCKNNIVYRLFAFLIRYKFFRTAKLMQKIFDFVNKCIMFCLGKNNRNKQNIK